MTQNRNHDGADHRDDHTATSADTTVDPSVESGGEERIDTSDGSDTSPLPRRETAGTSATQRSYIHECDACESVHSSTAAYCPHCGVRHPDVPRR